MVMVTISVGPDDGDSDSATIGADVASTELVMVSISVILEVRDSELAKLGLSVGEAEGTKFAESNSATVGATEGISARRYPTGDKETVPLSLESGDGTHSNNGTP
jgi:hypothetical protein